MQEGEAVERGEGPALSAKLKMQKDLATESNIMTQQQVKTTAHRHLNAQVVPLDSFFSFSSAQLQGS